MTMGTNAPNGLVPYGMQGGGMYNGATSEYLIATTPYAVNIFTGDPVSLSAGYVIIGVAGSPIIGVFQGCKYIDANGVAKFSPYWPASTVVLSGTKITALVIDDPRVIYSIQETNGSGVAGTPLTQATGPGFNYNFLIGTGHTASGQSTTSLNNASANTTLNLKITQLDPTINNVAGAFANWLVTINNAIFSGGTGTVDLT
jgi:hypothetical protein